MELNSSNSIRNKITPYGLNFITHYIRFIIPFLLIIESLKMGARPAGGRIFSIKENKVARQLGVLFSRARGLLVTALLKNHIKNVRAGPPSSQYCLGFEKAPPSHSSCDFPNTREKRARPLFCDSFQWVVTRAFFWRMGGQAPYLNPAILGPLM